MSSSIIKERKEKENLEEKIKWHCEVLFFIQASYGN